MKKEKQKPTGSNDWDILFPCIGFMLMIISLVLVGLVPGDWLLSFNGAKLGIAIAFLDILGAVYLTRFIIRVKQKRTGSG